VFPTASAAAENAREEKTVLACGHCRSGAEAENDSLSLLLNDTPQLHCRPDMMVVKCSLHEKLLLQSCRLYAV